LRKCKLLYHGLRFIRESKDNFSVRAIIHLFQKNINLSEIVDLAIDERKSLWSIIKEKSPPQLSAFIKIFKTLEIIGRSTISDKLIFFWKRCIIARTEKLSLDSRINLNP
ncbi:unnamed protein product, partial [marine sediment metagenome]